MSDLQNKIDDFKQVVIKNCQNPSFAYREWFITDHLAIVERIAMELCDRYPDADRNVVRTLVWFHDFGKPIDEENEYEITESAGVEAMRAAGLPEDLIKKVLAHWTRMEMKEEIDVAKEAIEVQIMSTADGASHFVGKFYSSYFRDDSKEKLSAVEDRIKEKIAKDWGRKIVLPEVKRMFQWRYKQAKEIGGDYPEKFLS